MQSTGRIVAFLLFVVGCGSAMGRKENPAPAGATEHVKAYVGAASLAAGGALAGVGGWKIVQSYDRRDRARAESDERKRDALHGEADRFETSASWLIPIGGSLVAAGLGLVIWDVVEYATAPKETSGLAPQASSGPVIIPLGIGPLSGGGFVVTVSRPF